MQKAAAHNLSLWSTVMRAAPVAAVPALVEASKSPHGPLRVAAIHALVSIAPDSREVVSILVQALSDPDRTMRGAAVMELRRIGPPAKDAVPALRELAQKEPERQLEVTVTIQVIEGSR